MRCALLLFLITLLTLPLYAEDSDNPFATGDDATISVTEESPTISVVRSDEKEAKLPFWYGYIRWQKKINDTLSNTMLDLKENFSIVKVALIFVISLIYSLMHTAGPGHGKVILGTYFLTSDKSHQKRDAAKAGLIVSLTHIGTAFGLSFIFFIILKSITAGSQSGDMTEKARFFGGIMVLITGTAIALSTLPFFKKRFHAIEEKLESLGKGQSSLIWFSVLSGIVPCPLAWFVLVFSISYNIYGYGILSVVAMAIGAAITVGTTGALMIHAKESATSHFSLEKLTGVASIIRFCGAIVLILFGSSMSFF